MKIVSPYLPFPPESLAHQRLGEFDWLGALEMLRASARKSCRCETYLLTESGYDPGGPTIHVMTSRRRLMLWILEASLRYLESGAFDEDTIFISPDTLVLKDLRFGFRAALGVIVRSTDKFADRKPILNGVQWWAHAAKWRLVDFYQRALAIADELHDDEKKWGGDTVPIVQLLSPVVVGDMERSGLSAWGWPRATTMATVTNGDIARLDRGDPPMTVAQPLVDFKYLRKLHMRPYYERVLALQGAA